MATGRLGRGVAVHQEYWRSLGTGRPDSWNLGFVVLFDNAMVGVQGLEADGFATRRTVDSSSWLVTEARGGGTGKVMRLAVLALAFDGLGAEVAETSAWDDNVASLGVSRSLGYTDNGVYRHAGHSVRIEGLEACLPFFGVS